MVQPQSIFDVLMKYEQATNLIDKKTLYAAIEAAIDNPPLTFIVFSCLAVERGKEELVLDFFKTMFFDGGSKPLSNGAKRAMRLVQEVEEMGVPVNVIPILVDTEPRRTWGWNVPQKELTLACQLMREEAVASKLLPSNWLPMLMSEIDDQYVGVLRSFEHIPRYHPDCAKYQLLIAQQEKHLRGFSGHYYFRGGIHRAAEQQVGAYASEGAVLENVYPNAILLQSEWPWHEKDPLYQWLRALLKKKPLPIIHPFPH